MWEKGTIEIIDFRLSCVNVCESASMGLLKVLFSRKI